MPIQYDAPTGVGALNEWGVYGASATDKCQAVLDNDGDSSVVYGVSGGRITTQNFTFPQLVGLTDPVDEIGLMAKARMYANGGGARIFKLISNGVTDTVNYGDNLYALRYSGYQTCIYLPADKSLGAVNGEQGFMCTAAGGPSNAMEIWVTWFYRKVTFSYAATGIGAGDLTHLVSSMVGALIGGNLLLRDMPGLARVLGRVWKGGRNVRLLDHELESAWRAWRTFRHPAFFDLGGSHALV